MENAVLVMTQKLLREKSKILPRLNILIYPWLHVYGTMLPSSLKYTSDVLNTRELGLWYLGEANFTQEMDDAVHLNHLMHLFEKEEQNNIANYLNISNVKEKYKQNDFYKKKVLEDLIKKNIPRFDQSNSILAKDANFAKKVKQLLNEDISPGLMANERLKKLPHTYEIGNVP